MMTVPLAKYFRSRFTVWLNRRLPSAAKIRLDQAKLFIFPSQAGFGFLALVVVLWLLATNYENNLVFAIACLLSSLLVTAILHSYANLAGLEVSFVGADPVFLGQEALFRIGLSRSGRRNRHSLRLRFQGCDTESAELIDTRELTVSLPIKALQRGWFYPGRVTLESRYPLGLLRVWTHLDLDCRVLVYPRPLPGAPIQPSLAKGNTGMRQATVGSDDFAGLKDYLIGEPLQHVAWKHYARERGLLSKHYADAIDERTWLDWEAYPAMDREQRLSRLCGRLLEVSQGQSEYGLRLPGVELPPARGEGHKTRVLRELALFELPGDALSPAGRNEEVT